MYSERVNKDPGRKQKLAVQGNLAYIAKDNLTKISVP